MATKKSYLVWLRDEMKTIIDSIDVDQSQKQYLKSRWLDQVIWMENKSKKVQWPYNLLRLTVIIGGIIVPTLISLQFDESIQIKIRWVTFGISLLVAICAAVEEFFHYGERWRHYRATVELLKSEGWQYFQLSGNYENFEKHQDAYSKFANQVEQIIKEDVKVYFTQVIREKPKKDKN